MAEPDTDSQPNTPDTADATAEAQTDDAQTSEAQADKAEQSVTVEDAGPALKRLHIEIPEQRIQDKIEESFEHLKNDAQLPGFRRGRAPRRLIERRFGDAVRNDVKGQIISEAYSQAIEEQELQPISEPDVKDIDNLELPESGPLNFDVEVEIAPTVELPPFEELKITRPSGEVSDADVDQELERLRETFGSMTTVEDGEVQADDFVLGDVHIYAGEDAGDDAEEIAHHPDSNIMVAGESRDYRGHVAGIVVDDLGQRLTGKQVGHVERVSMTGPESHEDQRIKNQPITITIEIQQIQRLQPGPVEDLLQQMGMESEDELKQRIRQMQEQRKQREQEQEVHKQIADQLVERVELELPEGLTSRQAERVIQRRRMELQYQGKDEQQIEQELAEMRSSPQEEAQRDLKLYFIMDQAARDLEVEVNEQEVNSQIAMMAMQQGRRPEKMRQEMRSRGELEQVYHQMRERKTYEQILEKAQVENEDGSAEENESQAAADESTEASDEKSE